MSDTRFTYELNIYSFSPAEESSPAYFDGLLGALNEYANAHPGTKLTATISPFKPNLDTAIRIDADATAMVGLYSPYVYLVAVPRGNFVGARVLYYFIRRCSWTANKSLELTLHMDILHTLLSSNDLSKALTAKTMILREHENRWSFVTKDSVSAEFLPKVDAVSEGLGSAPLWHKSDSIIYDERFKGNSVIYESWQASFFKVTSEQTTISAVGLNPTKVTVPFEATIGETTIKEGISKAETLNTLNESVSKAIIYPYFPFGRIRKLADGYYTWEQGNTTIFPADGGDAIKGKTLEAMITDTMTYPTAGTTYSNNPFASIDMLASETQSILVEKFATNAPRTLKDSKLYKSDYYKHSFVYGNYEFAPQYERYDWKSATNHKYDIYIFADMIPVSSFSFQFEAQKGSDGKSYFEYHGLTPFDETLDIAQNNERALFTDSYLNYLKNGYNYDLIKQGASIVGAGVTGIGAILGATAVAGPAGTIAAGVGALINIATTTISTETSLQEKQEQLKASSLKASGVSTYGAFRATKGDKLHECIATISDTLAKTIDDLFYYYGYKRNYQGVPNTTNRYWFNFVQCTPKYKSGFARSWSYLLDELTKLFQNGVTFFHRHADAITTNYGYDLEQEKENWETNILEANQ